MDIQQQELQKAIDFVRQTFADKKIILDYSPASVKHLDTLLDNEFKNGKLRNPESSFAKFQGLILTGISGYIAQIIIKNSDATQVAVDPNDSKWFMNFTVASPSGLSVQPGLRVIKRMLQGPEMGLYAYVLSAIKYFSPNASLQDLAPDLSMADTSGNAKKPWWKFWP